MNPASELEKLTSPFPGGCALFKWVKNVPAALTPEPFKALLVHNHHMTMTMEAFHRSSVSLKVIDRRLERDVYSRKILLERAIDARVVQFALVQIDLSVVSPTVRDKILSEQMPLGRILVDHNLLCQIALGAILKIRIGPAFARSCDCLTNMITFGRFATIFCNQRPAISLLEVVVPPSLSCGLVRN